MKTGVLHLDELPYYFKIIGLGNDVPITEGRHRKDIDVDEGKLDPRLRAKLPTYRSDNWRILDWMAKGHKITVMQCVRMFNTPNLRSRISELESYGWPIKREPVKVNGKRFNRYYMR